MQGERVGAGGLLAVMLGLLADVAALALVLAMAATLILVGGTLELNRVLIAALDGLAVIGLWACTRNYRAGRSASFAAVCLAPVILVEIARLNLHPLPPADLLGYFVEWACLTLLFGDILGSLGRMAVRRLRHDTPAARVLLHRLDA